MYPYLGKSVRMTILVSAKALLTLLSATSGFNHLGNALAASIKRNSPSVSTTLIHRFEYRLLNSLRIYTMSHSSSTESP